MKTVFVSKAEATQRFGFVADAKDIPKWRRMRRPLPEKFSPAIRTDTGEVLKSKRGEAHADLILRTGEYYAEEGYTYDA